MGGKVSPGAVPGRFRGPPPAERRLLLPAGTGFGRHAPPEDEDAPTEPNRHDRAVVVRRGRAAGAPMRAHGARPVPRAKAMRTCSGCPGPACGSARRRRSPPRSPSARPPCLGNLPSRAAALGGGLRMALRHPVPLFGRARAGSAAMAGVAQPATTLRRSRRRPADRPTGRPGMDSLHGGDTWRDSRPPRLAETALVHRLLVHRLCEQPAPFRRFRPNGVCPGQAGPMPRRLAHRRRDPDRHAAHGVARRASPGSRRRAPPRRHGRSRRTSGRS